MLMCCVAPVGRLEDPRVCVRVCVCVCVGVCVCMCVCVLYRRTDALHTSMSVVHTHTGAHIYVCKILTYKYLPIE